MTIDRVIATVAVIGCLWLFSTAGIWGPIVDGLECRSTPTMERKAVRL